MRNEGDLDPDDIRVYVQRRFIPFLGAACSSSEWTPESKALVRRRLRKVNHDFKTRREASSENQLFDSLARHKGVLEPGETGLESARNISADDVHTSEERLELQVGIAILYSECMRSVRDSLSLPRFITGHPPGVDPHEGLATTFKSHVEKPLSAWKPAKEPYPHLKEVPPLPNKSVLSDYLLKDLAIQIRHGSGRLTLDLVSWLGQFLWYLFRYDIPKHPSTRELAFELMLTEEVRKHLEEPEERFRLLSLSEIGDILDNHHEKEPRRVQKTLRKEINERFGWYDNNRGPPPKIHQAIAKYLHTLTGPGAKPIVFTTNYDTNLERALNQAKCPFRVTYPIPPEDWGKPPGGQEDMRWAYYEFDSNGEFGARAKGIVGPKKATAPSNYDGFMSRGPLIVKLHGSRRLPESDGCKALNIPPDVALPRPKHSLIVMSQRSYLRVMKEGIPPWVEDQMRPAGGGEATGLWEDGAPNEEEPPTPASNGDSTEKDTRDIVSLGYSFSDWNVRLQFTDVERTAQKVSTEITVTKDRFDTLDRIFLSNIDVIVRTEELESLAEKLEEVLCENGKEPSPGVVE